MNWCGDKYSSVHCLCESDKGVQSHNNGHEEIYSKSSFSNVSHKHEHHTRTQTRQSLNLVKPKNNQLK